VDADDATDTAMKTRRLALHGAFALSLVAIDRAWTGAQVPSTSGRPPADDSVTIRIVATELRAAVRILGQYLDHPVLFSGQGAALVTVETPVPVPRSSVPSLLRGVLESEGYELALDSSATLYRARPRAPPSFATTPPLPGPGAASRRSDGVEPTELFVLALEHARAADVAQTVSALYRRDASVSPAARTAALYDEPRPPSMTGSALLDAPGSTSGIISRQPASFTGDIAIVPDARANSLLVRANRSDFELVRAVVRQLDVRPLQALIEVLIAEVRRDRGLTFGASSALPATAVGKGGATMTAVTGASPSPGLGDFVLRVMGVGGIEVEAALRAASERGDVRILSRPVILTANNERAEIVVGTQRPFVQLSRALPTDAAVRDQIVQYRDVGTKLSVRPTIGGDGSVQLEVMQEVSSATSETQFNAPVIATRSVQTHLLARDGQTIALGGLTDRQHDSSRSGVPLLSSIPLLGGFFGRSSSRTTETELFVFLTPRVIRSDEDAMRLSRPLRERADRVKP
jgi:general secretion pathway protein D